MPWVTLCVAGLLEVVWAGALKEAASSGSVGSFVLAAVANVASVALLWLALRALPVGTAYAAWVGVGTLGTVIVGMVRFHEPARPLRLSFLGLLLVALVGLRLTE